MTSPAAAAHETRPARAARPWGVGRWVIAAVAAMCAVLAQAHAEGASTSWKGHGPDGGTPTAFAVSPSSPNVVYAGSATGGVFKSTDGGVSWAGASDGLGNFGIVSLAVHAADPLTVYAGTTGGVYRSTDGGATWETRGLPALWVSGLAIDPVTPTIVHAGIFGGSVAKSVDAGATWVGTNLFAGGGKGRVAVDPVTPSTVYASVYQGGVFKSVDGGTSWARSDTGISNNRVETLAVDPTSPSTVYAPTQGGGVFKTTDGGVSWSAVNTGLGVTSIAAFGMAPSSPGTLYAGNSTATLYKSVNGGASWSALPTVVPSASASLETMTVDPSNAAKVYLGPVFGGPYRTTDGGTTWTSVIGGFAAAEVRALALAPADPDVVYATARVWPLNGVYRSANGGALWFAVGPNVVVNALAHDPGAASTVYAGTNGGGIHKTTNAGGAWTVVNSGLGNLTVFSLATHPSSTGVVYAGTNNGVFRTVNGGTSWSASAGLPGSSSVRTLAVDPTDTNVVYAGLFSGGVYRTADAGATWSPAGTGLPPSVTHAVVVAPTVPSTIYVGTANGIYRSVDAGTSWAPIMGDLPGAAYDTRALAIDPGDPTVLYSGSAFDGVFVTVDDGSSWHPINDGLTSRSARALAVDALGRIYAGTDGAGVFRRDALAECGDGVTDPGETCDDGNTTAGDCCGAACQLETLGSPCAADGNLCTDDVCDGAGACIHPHNAAPCDDGLFCNGADTCSGGACDAHAGGPCTVVTDCAGICDEAADTCFRPAGTECAADASPCTLDVCDGAGACTHPPGNTGTECRAPGGPCDVAETCTGVSGACPADGFLPEGTACRAALGSCDAAEACTGTGPSCPSDAFVGMGIECRAAADACDAAEACTGSSRFCPTDESEPVGTPCRAAAGDCDLAETCDGVSTACPADGHVPDGASCDDGAACTVDDQCTAGVCVGSPTTCGDGDLDGGCGEECDDGGTTPGDGCDATCRVEPGCGTAPNPVCRTPFVGGKAVLKIRRADDPAKHKLQWQWNKGGATSKLDYGNPLGADDYYLCLYDAGVLRSTTSIPAGGVCAGKPCWRELPTSFQLKDKELTPDGVAQVKLAAGADGKAKIQLKGRGGLLEIPNPTTFTGPVEVQLVRIGGLCWSATYGAPFARQDAGSFIDKSD